MYQEELKYVDNGVFKIADDVLESKKYSEIPKSPELYTKTPKKFIDQLLSAKHILNDDEIRDDINTIIAAVSEKDCK